MELLKNWYCLHCNASSHTWRHPVKMLKVQWGRNGTNSKNVQLYQVNKYNEKESPNLTIDQENSTHPKGWAQVCPSPEIICFALEQRASQHMLKQGSWSHILPKCRNLLVDPCNEPQECHNSHSEYLSMAKIQKWELDIINLKHLRTLKKCILGKLATHKDRMFIPVNLPLIRRPIITAFTVSMLKLECNL
jgi:hypothetical protein